jgi:hypothetical protein
MEQIGHDTADLSIGPSGSAPGRGEHFFHSRIESFEPLVKLCQDVYSFARARQLAFELPMLFVDAYDFMPDCRQSAFTRTKFGLAIVELSLSRYLPFLPLCQLGYECLLLPFDAGQSGATLFPGGFGGIELSFE